MIAVHILAIQVRRQVTHSFNFSCRWASWSSRLCGHSDDILRTPCLRAPIGRRRSELSVMHVLLYALCVSRAPPTPHPHPVHQDFSVVEVIGKKREGRVLTEHEIVSFVHGFATDEIPDYQCAAFLMAVCCQGMTQEETAILTQAMKDSGTTADLSDVAGPKVDKHSTGGVGDKTSLILAPICASLGAVVPMMSGRGLGHTGGTLDKLESIPGFRVAMGPEEFKDVLRSAGAAIIGTTADMAPADRKMYALRDVTSTVVSLPLITGSIMCKKLAENPDSLVLDVKTGAGAFMAAEEDAIELAQSMIGAGEGDGKATTAFVTGMDQPLGQAVGNWIEVAEAM